MLMIEMPLLSDMCQWLRGAVGLERVRNLHTRSSLKTTNIRIYLIQRLNNDHFKCFSMIDISDKTWSFNNPFFE